MWGVLRPGRTVGQQVSEAYDDVLFHGSTLQDLPADGAGPRFVVNATNVQTGKLFRFSHPYQGDYSVGLWSHPNTLMADAVTASSAFPPVLSPHTFTPSGTYASGQDVIYDDPAFRSTLWMSDGGVYDNLGLETAWKRYRTILVSDGGGVLRTERNPKRNWGEHVIRVSEIVDSQVRALRKRQLIDGYVSGIRSGAYWSDHSCPQEHSQVMNILPPVDFLTRRHVRPVRQVPKQVSLPLVVNPSEHDSASSGGGSIGSLPRMHVQPRPNVIPLPVLMISGRQATPSPDPAAHAKKARNPPNGSGRTNSPLASLATLRFETCRPSLSLVHCGSVRWMTTGSRGIGPASRPLRLRMTGVVTLTAFFTDVPFLAACFLDSLRASVRIVANEAVNVNRFRIGRDLRQPKIVWARTTAG